MKREWKPPENGVIFFVDCDCVFRFYNPPSNQGPQAGYYGYDQQPQQQQMPQPPMMPGNFAQQQQQQQQQPANFMTPAAPIQQQPQQQQQPPKAAPAPAAAKPKEILPIPPEHLDLQTTFDGLRLKCMSAASHPVRYDFMLSCS